MITSLRCVLLYEGSLKILFFVLLQGGSAGGVVREAGGALGKRQVALEEEYFHRKVRFYFL